MCTRYGYQTWFWRQHFSWAIQRNIKCRRIVETFQVGKYWTCWACMEWSRETCISLQSVKISFWLCVWDCSIGISTTRLPFWNNYFFGEKVARWGCVLYITPPPISYSSEFWLCAGFYCGSAPVLFRSTPVPLRFHSGSTPVPLRFRSGSTPVPLRLTPVPLRFHSGSTPVPLRFHSGSTPVPLRFHSGSAPVPLRFRSGSAPVPLRFHSGSTPVPLRFHSGSAPVPLRYRSGSAPVPLRFHSGSALYIREDYFAQLYFPKLRSVDVSDYNGVVVAVVGNPGVGSDEWQYLDSRCG